MLRAAGKAGAVGRQRRGRVRGWWAVELQRERRRGGAVPVYVGEDEARAGEVMAGEAGDVLLAEGGGELLKEKGGGG